MHPGQNLTLFNTISTFSKRNNTDSNTFLNTHKKMNFTHGALKSSIVKTENVEVSKVN